MGLAFPSAPGPASAQAPSPSHTYLCHHHRHHIPAESAMLTRTRRRESMVRRAVARRIVQQMRLRHKSRHEHRHEHRHSQSGGMLQSSSYIPDAIRPSSPATVAAIATLVATMSAARTGSCSDDLCDGKSNDCAAPSAGQCRQYRYHPAASTPELSDAETEIIQRIIELQREKELLLRLMDQGGNDGDGISTDH